MSSLNKSLFSIPTISIALILCYVIWFAADKDSPIEKPSALEPNSPAVLRSGILTANTIPTLPNSTIIEALNQSSNWNDLYWTDQSDLIINHELLKLFCDYLTNSDIFYNELKLSDLDKNSTALLQGLHSKLPEKAFNQAESLVLNFKTYLIEHDELLARQGMRLDTIRLDSIDLNRLANWHQQRKLLRQRIFGMTVSTAWFDNDEAQLQQAIAELAKSATLPLQSQEDVADHGIDQAKMMNDRLLHALKFLLKHRD